MKRTRFSTRSPVLLPCVCDVAAGCTCVDVIQTRDYVDKPADLAEYNRIHRECFKAPLPARTTITSCLGGTLRYETECVAVKKAA